MAVNRNINNVLNEIQAKLVVGKDLNNNFGKYSYRSAETILEHLRPLLRVTGSVLTMDDEMVLVGERYYVSATATLTYDGKSVSTVGLARESETKKGMDSSQITGSASSYARKYALCGLFAINGEKDADFYDNTGAGGSDKQSHSPSDSPASTPKKAPRKKNSAVNTTKDIDPFVQEPVGSFNG